MTRLHRDCQRVFTVFCFICFLSVVLAASQSAVVADHAVKAPTGLKIEKYDVKELSVLSVSFNDNKVLKLDAAAQKDQRQSEQLAEEAAGVKSGRSSGTLQGENGNGDEAARREGLSAAPATATEDSAKTAANLMHLADSLLASKATSPEDREALLPRTKGLRQTLSLITAGNSPHGTERKAATARALDTSQGETVAQKGQDQQKKNPDPVEGGGSKSEKPVADLMESLGLTPAGMKELDKMGLGNLLRNQSLTDILASVEQMVSRMKPTTTTTTTTTPKPTQTTTIVVASVGGAVGAITIVGVLSYCFISRKHKKTDAQQDATEDATEDVKGDAKEDEEAASAI